MKAAHSSHAFFARSQAKMIRVPEDDLGTAYKQLLVGESFDSPLRSNRHKDRRLDDTMTKRQAAPSGRCVWIIYKKLKSDPISHREA
jgi:hypothetical protein